MIACRDCGFESRRRRGCLSLVSVVCFQVEVSATGRFLVQMSPIDCGVSLCVIQKPPETGGPSPHWAVESVGKGCFDSLLVPKDEGNV